MIDGTVAARSTFSRGMAVASVAIVLFSTFLLAESGTLLAQTGADFVLEGGGPRRRRDLSLGGPWQGT